LALNILFTLALMVLIKAPFTLPGLAGLVLTVGMSVDANVLIYERIREELARGAALRMALRNGFARATTTIIDSNVTTIATAVILYAIGTDQLRGFAVLLILGLLTSMFTAIFCARVFFDVVERTRFLTTLKMFQFLPETKIDFIGYRHLAVAGSLVLLLIGAGAALYRGEDLFDIDFTGGSSVHVMLEQPARTEDVRKLFDQQFAALKIPFTLTGMSLVPGQTMNNMFKVDAKVEQVEQLEKILQETFAQAGGGIKLATYSMDYSDLHETVVAASAASTRETPSTTTKAGAAKDNEVGSPESKAPQSKAETKSDSAAPQKSSATEPERQSKPADPESSPAKTEPVTPEPVTPEKEKTESAKEPATPGKEPSEGKPKEASAPAAPQGAAIPLPADNVLALAAPLQAETPTSQAKTDPEAKADSPAKAEPGKTEPAKTEPAKEEVAEKKPTDPQDAAAAKKSPESPPTAAPETRSEAPPTDPASPPPATAAPGTTLVETKLTFGHAINAATLRSEVEQMAQELNVPLSYFDVSNPQWDGIGSNSYTEWTLRLSLNKENAQKVLDKLQEKFASEPVWPSSSTIGPTVAGRMQRTAIMALVCSWLAIIVYVWIRFQNLVFGLAAVIALVHDVLITVTALAVSHWLTGALGFLLVEDFKISLTIVAALLTIIGFSINDTIVIFDRIREVRGKSPEVTTTMVNLSVNQTLGRTLLTFFTVFIVVVCLYGLGGQGIHGFAFAMLIGLLTGTYSTVFIATPFVLWLARKKIEAQPTPKLIPERSLR
jgi:SecD/SecF fusion protein